MSEVEKPSMTPSVQMSHLYHKDLAAHTVIPPLFLSWLE